MLSFIVSSYRLSFIQYIVLKVLNENFNQYIIKFNKKKFLNIKNILIRNV